MMGESVHWRVGVFGLGEFLRKLLVQNFRQRGRALVGMSQLQGGETAPSQRQGVLFLTGLVHF